MSGQRREFHLRHLANREHAVYSVWRDEECLYVGMTSDWWHRTGVHLNRYADELTHIDVWHVGASRPQAEALEAATIRGLDPRDNYAHSPRAQRARDEWDAHVESGAAARAADHQRRSAAAAALLPDLTA